MEVGVASAKGGVVCVVGRRQAGAWEWAWPVGGVGGACLIGRR